MAIFCARAARAQRRASQQNVVNEALSSGQVEMALCLFNLLNMNEHDLFFGPQKRRRALLDWLLWGATKAKFMENWPSLVEPDHSPAISKQ